MLDFVFTICFLTKTHQAWISSRAGSWACRSWAWWSGPWRWWGQRWRSPSSWWRSRRWTPDTAPGQPITDEGRGHVTMFDQLSTNQSTVFTLRNTPRPGFTPQPEAPVQNNTFWRSYFYQRVQLSLSLWIIKNNNNNQVCKFRVIVKAVPWAGGPRCPAPGHSACRRGRTAAARWACPRPRPPQGRVPRRGGRGSSWATQSHSSLELSTKFPEIITLFVEGP